MLTVISELVFVMLLSDSSVYVLKLPTFSTKDGFGRRYTGSKFTTIGDVSLVTAFKLDLNESRELSMLTGVPIGLSERGFRKLLLLATSVVPFWMPNFEKSVKRPSFFVVELGY